MTDILPFLQRLGIHQYHDAFVAEGFETWETVLDIQESDLETLGVKLGHRRRLQRAIAEYRGISGELPIAAPSHHFTAAPIKTESVTQISGIKEATVSSTTEHKRKYRRHPKPDENAPEKPPSAYVLFSNRVREEIKGNSLSFTEIARLVGERWQRLEPAQKEIYDSHATALKDNYNTELAEYKKTKSYREYAQYLADFKAKHGTTSEAKRPKLEAQNSSNSGGDGADYFVHGSSHLRGDSIGSSSVASQMGGSILQLVTSLPVHNAAVSRRGSPPSQSSQERRVPGLLSERSSTSEGSFGARFESTDGLTRTAPLLLAGQAARTPPPNVPTGSRLGRRDPSHGSESLKWPAQQALYHYPASASSATSPNSMMSSYQAGVAVPEQWRDRSTDARSFYTSPNSQPPQSLGSMQISHLVGPSHAQDSGSVDGQRSLPPLRQLTGTPTNTPHASFDARTTSSSVHQYHSQNESMVFRHTQSRGVPNQSESEAADALAGLMDQSRPPRTWQDRR